MEETKKKKMEKRKRRILLLIILLLLLIIGGLLWYFMQKQEEKPGRDLSAGVLPGSEELDFSGVGEESIAMQINSRPTFEDGKSEGSIYIGNAEENLYDLQVVIKLTETGEQVYDSGIIPPGHYIDYDRLDVELEAGEYEALAELTYYTEEGVVQSRTNAKQTIIIHN